MSYWHCDDIEERVRLLIEAGAKELQPIKDVGGGKLIASVTDADSNPIGLLQPPK